MPRPALRSTSLRRTRKKTPGGASVIHYEKKKVGKHVCSSCKKPLYGVPRGRKNEIKKLPKTKKRPTRPYGGNLCSKCMRSLIKRERVFKAQV